MTRIADNRRDPRILLVEDNPGDVVLFRHAVKGLEIEIELLVERSAESALAYLKTGISDQRGQWPDLILTDINLPGMTGIDLLRAIKSDEALRRMPCVVLSSSESPQDIIAAYDAHANGYISKRTSPDQYQDMVQKLTAYWFGLMRTASSAPSVRLHSKSDGNWANGTDGASCAASES